MDLETKLDHMRDADEVSIGSICSYIDDLAEYIADLCDVLGEKEFSDVGGSELGRIGFSVDNLTEQAARIVTEMHV